MPAFTRQKATTYYHRRRAMTKFHLPTLQTVLLTVGKNTGRHDARRKFFSKYGFTNVKWVVGRRTHNHHHGAREMAIQTLESYSAPFLWLEDDARVLPAYQDIIDVPDDADVAYLGGHSSGAAWKAEQAMRRQREVELLSLAKHVQFPPGWPRPALFCETQHDGWIRLLSMVGGHAILWISDHVQKEFLRLLKTDHTNKPYDVTFALHQWRYIVYCLKAPWFYQADGRHDRVTQLYYTGEVVL